jgi:UDP-N-acetylmuramate--alanine ligase
MEKRFENIYFLGIGGIGMSALAQYFLAAGYRIAGYDKVRSEICMRLEKAGILIHYEDNLNMVPSYFKDPQDTLVIFTPAIPEEHTELNWFKSKGFKISKRAEILGMISNPKKGLAIAGTHGKTSVSGITANIMSITKKSCSAFLGGIAKNRDSNIIIDTKSDYVVVEADEFDRSFHRLEPSTALITCIEADHLDIYNNYETLYEAFQIFANKLRHHGNLVLNNSIENDFTKALRRDIKVFRYGVNDNACEFNLNNIEYSQGKCSFDINHPGGRISGINYGLGGHHNLENALAGASISLLNGASPDDIRRGLETFRGMVRRFDFRAKTPSHIYIDDYAHHPGEIKAFLNAVKLLYPDKKITGIFQPHLYSRTADFYEGFAESLSLCDELILLPIYPAREKPMPGVNSEMILKLVESPQKQICEKEELIPLIERIKPELLVSMGAGDIDVFVPQLTRIMSK